MTFRPSAPPEAGSNIVVLGPALLATLVAALAIAALLRRSTLRGLAALNEDIELAVAGQLDAVKDPLGAKPLQDLANTVTYLVTRLRSGGASEAGAPGTGAASSMSQRRGAGPAADLIGKEARIETDPQFRVTSASPDCAQLVGVRPDALVGRHLLDALPDLQVAEAVLKCIGALAASGEERAIATPTGQPYRLDVLVTRTGTDQPLTVTLRAVAS
jgi:hypothetical protein